MLGRLPVPVAQYLRVSTEHQQYSLDNQQAAINEYAEKLSLKVVHTYLDQGRSGLALKRRNALQQLLADVVSGNCQYKAILVYDVSRWGRFQDVDEAAHYEFLCRNAGVNVHYCVEQFSEDSSLPGALMKTLKRVMAGEYSRELSTKVHEGSKKVAESGFRTGGEPGYGLRRMLVSSTRQPKHLLANGERKSLQSDHVILVPGPDEEVKCVQSIFQMFVHEHKWPKAIANELKARRIKYRGTRRADWYAEAVNRILKNPKYCGSSVFGRSSFRLRVQRVHNSPELWTVKQCAWQGIVDRETFAQAQMIFRSQTVHKTDQELLDALQRVLKDRGTLSEKLVNQSSDLPSVGPYVRRFGSLSEAFAKAGYITRLLNATRARRSTKAMRDEIVRQIIAIDPNHISICKPNGHYRARLLVLGRLVSIYLCRCRVDKNGQLCWPFLVVRRERHCIALIVRLDRDNQSIMDMFIVPNTGGQSRYNLTLEDTWLRQGKQMAAISEFIGSVQSVKEVARRQ